MELKPEQKDALTELINIGYGRAASALSELTGYRIALEVPQVTVHFIEEIVPLLRSLMELEVASVDQTFSGTISGSALLILDAPGAASLSRLLLNEHEAEAGLDASAQEVITEVGNILLNACLGVFGNLLEVPIAFSVPRFQANRIDLVFRTVTEEARERLTYGLMIHTRFSLQGGNISGYLVIVLGVSSMDRLLQELDRWENRQTL